MSSSMHTGCHREWSLVPAERAERWRVRAGGAAVALPCLAVLVAAGLLAPSPSGLGTHERLGLPPCSFLSRAHLPCPTCGLTTAVSAAAHGRIGPSLRAHPFGLVAWAGALVLAASGTVQAATARRALRALRPGPWWAWAATGGVLGGWVVRLATGLACGELPIR